MLQFKKSTSCIDKCSPKPPPPPPCFPFPEATTFKPLSWLMWMPVSLNNIHPSRPQLSHCVSWGLSSLSRVSTIAKPLCTPHFFFSCYRHIHLVGLILSIRFVFYSEWSCCGKPLLLSICWTFLLAFPWVLVCLVCFLTLCYLSCFLWPLILIGSTLLQHN